MVDDTPVDGRPLLQALDGLRRNLDEVDATYKLKRRNDSKYEGLDETVLSLKAVLDFLEEIGITNSWRPVMLKRLVVVLADIRRGIAHPLTTPSICARPPDMGLVVALKAMAAAAMQLAMDTGVKKENAAKTVANVLTKAGFRLPGRGQRPPSAGTVAGWRDKFIGHSGNTEGANVYEVMLQPQSLQRRTCQESHAGIRKPRAGLQ
jgi:hypothetical protein